MSGPHCNMPVHLYPEFPTVSPNFFSWHLYLGLSGSLFSTNYIVPAVLHALNSLELEFLASICKTISSKQLAPNPQHRSPTLASLPLQSGQYLVYSEWNDTACIQPRVWERTCQHILSSASTHMLKARRRPQFSVAARDKQLHLLT